MKATIVNKYFKRDKVTKEISIDKNGNPIRVYVYAITHATGQELQDYELNQGVNYKVDEATGSPLYFTTNFEGNVIDLLKSKVMTQTGDVITAYRAMCSEDFELKRMAQLRPATVAIATPKATAKVDVSNATFE